MEIDNRHIIEKDKKYGIHVGSTYMSEMHKHFYYSPKFFHLKSQVFENSKLFVEGKVLFRDIWKFPI